jgi:hypothetical protein
MVYAIGLAEEQLRIDSLADRGHCAGQIVWDKVHGWLPIDGWYACRSPVSGRPREILAAPAEGQP